MRDTTPTPWDCHAALDALQRELDGDGPALDVGLSQHLKQCRDCRERFAAARLLMTVYPPGLATDFTERVAVAVRADTQGRLWNRMLAGAVGMAACVALAVWLGQPTPVVRESAVTQAAPAWFADARVQLRQRTDEIVQALPKDWTPTIVNGDDLGAAIEPATISLAGATRGLADGFEPVTGSAKRAFAMFRRELPVE